MYQQPSIKTKKQFEFYLYNKPTLVVLDWYNISHKSKDIDLKRLYEYLKSYEEVSEIIFYNGLIPGNLNSISLLEKAEEIGYKVCTKKAKYLKTDSGKILKCDFDADIVKDIFVNIDKYDNIILFSGDGDFASTVKHLIEFENKKVYVVYRYKAFGAFDYKEFGLITKSGKPVKSFYYSPTAAFKDKINKIPPELTGGPDVNIIANI